MADEELRRLELGARAQPSDTTAGWSYARALGRAGDRRRQFREVARLARLGHPESLRAVDRWVPCGNLEEQVRTWRTGIVGDPRVRVARLPWSGFARPVGATKGALVVSTHHPGGFGAVDASSLERIWWIDRPEQPRRDVRLCGDDLVVLEGRRLDLRDAGTGAVLASAEIPGPAGSLSVAGDRALVVLTERTASGGGGSSGSGPLRLVVVNLGDDFGRIVWRGKTQPCEQSRIFARPDRIVLGLRGAELAVADLETGRTLKKHHAGSFEDVEAVDAAGVIVRRFEGEDMRVVELSLESLEPRWSHPSIEPPLVSEREAVCVGSLTANPGKEIAAVDRTSGAVRWTCGTRRAIAFTKLAICDDVFYMANEVEDAFGVVRVSGVSLETGQCVFACDLEVDRKHRGVLRPASDAPVGSRGPLERGVTVNPSRPVLELVPLDRALLVIGKSWIARLE